MCPGCPDNHDDHNDHDYHEDPVDYDDQDHPVQKKTKLMWFDIEQFPKLPEAHKKVLNRPRPLNEDTQPVIFLRGSGHQKSESVNRN